ncbi:hypothetical protein CTAYLR_003281 [Chrysophaeum taylorii]|uniref:Aminotransferase class I/classII large domain-containing protein n=1 Tax=Chrysophaeum taylorii TaxID=2483200 RepID=A0AAD7XJ10_9STRA|nr:hypothetical protein CTAYLR_003281 [Chrysophaeum taylorii]
MSGGLFGPGIAEIWGPNARRRMKRQREAEASDPLLDMEARGTTTPKRTPKKSRREARKVPVEVERLIGEAHVDLISGHEDRAIQVLGEVVRRAPDLPEAYSTLSEVFEARGGPPDLERAQQLSLVAAHLAPQDAAAWRRVAMLSLELVSRGKAVERTAAEALSRVLKLEPRDAAAAADRAALRAASGDANAAVDELLEFVNRRRRRGEATADDVAVELALAENALEAGRRDVAREALRRAMSEALGIEEAGAMRDRAALELATLDYGDGRWCAALETIDRAAEARGARTEPLDLAVLRGACGARLGRGAEALETWRPLVASARVLARRPKNDDDDDEEEDLALARREHADMLETCVAACAGSADVNALLDAIARLHSAMGNLREEARAHARIADRLRQRGSAVAARRRVYRALAAAPNEALVLAVRADLAVAGCDLLELAAVEAAFEPLEARAARGEPPEADEHAAWCAYGRVLSEGLDARRAPRLLAIGVALAKRACEASGGLGGAGRALAFVDVAYLSKAAAALDEVGSPSDLLLERRVREYGVAPPPPESLAWCVQALATLGLVEAAASTLEDAARLCAAAPRLAPLSRKDVDELAARYGLSLRDVALEPRVRGLAMAVSAVAQNPRDKAAVREFGRALKAARAPEAGTAARRASEIVAAALVEENDQETEGPALRMLAAALDDDPRRALARLEKKEKDDATPPEDRALVRAALLADVAATKPSTKAPAGETTTRHALVLAAAVHLDEYAESKKSTEPLEVLYNRGRFYHALGLGALAEPLYRRVLAAETPTTLHRLAAHNLIVLLHRDGHVVDDAPRRILRAHLRRRARGRLREVVEPTPPNLVDFASNDYLGIARDLEVQRAALFAELEETRTDHQANGSTGSRVLTGSAGAHDALEAWLADFHGAEAALLFASGYAANAGAMACLPGPEDAVLFDELSHSSTRFGISRGRQRVTATFKHNDLDDLERQLAILDASATFVCVESVYSMDGDRAPLEELAAVCAQSNACLVVDEAHATGVVGPSGRGAVSELDPRLRKNVLCSVHTFGKAVGSHGAAVLGSRDLRTYLVNYAQTFVYATALPPAASRLARRCYESLAGSDGDLRRDRLDAVATALRDHLAHLVRGAPGDITLLDSASPIHALVVPGADRVSAVAASARRQGFDVRPIRPPTVPEGADRLRIVAHAHNTVDEVEALAAVLFRALRDTDLTTT